MYQFSHASEMWVWQKRVNGHQWILGKEVVRESGREECRHRVSVHKQAPGNLTMSVRILP